MAAPELLPIMHREPEAMSTRARVILWAHLAGLGAISATMLACGWMYQSIAWRFLLESPSLAFWGVVFGVLALICGLAAVTRNADTARIGLLGAAVLAFIVSVAISLSWLEALDTDAPFSPLIPILLLLLVVADGVIGAQPIRVPLERLVSRYKRSVKAS